MRPLLRGPYSAFTAALVCLSVLPACGGDSNGLARIEAEGQWSGPVQGTGGAATLVLTLTETNGSVTGSGNMSSATDAIALTATGTYTQPSLSLTLSSPGFSNMNLSATVGATSMTGTLNGSGFVNSGITLERQ